tara:strand:- start:717 stop:884 length:168 start_codon:yes stop_codon:yes gene_type:complete
MGYNRISIDLANYFDKVLGEEDCEIIQLKLSEEPCTKRTSLEKDWCHVCRRRELQ